MFLRSSSRSSFGRSVLDANIMNQVVGVKEFVCKIEESD